LLFHSKLSMYSNGRGGEDDAPLSSAYIDNSSDDSNHYDGVDYGSDDGNDGSNHYDGVDYGSDGDVSDGDNNNFDSEVNDLLETICDSEEEHYDILADNGEFAYSEYDQRPYISTSSPASDALYAEAQQATSTTMIAITEEEGRKGDDDIVSQAALENDLEEDATESKITSTNQDVLVAQRESKLPLLQEQQPQATPTSMYQMPQNYDVPSNNRNSNQDVAFDDGIIMDDDRSSSSSHVAGSIREMVHEIDDVLDTMLPETSGNFHHPPNDNDTIASDVSVGGTTRLTGELERAQNVFWEFSGIDARNFRGRKRPKPHLLSDDSPGCLWGIKRSTMVKLFVVSLTILGALIGMYVALRDPSHEMETSVASSVYNDPVNSSVVEAAPPTLSPMVVGEAVGSISTGSESNPTPLLDPFAKPESTFAPSLRPSNRVVPSTQRPTGIAKTSILSTQPTTSASLSPPSQLSGSRVPGEVMASYNVLFENQDNGTASLSSVDSVESRTDAGEIDQGVSSSRGEHSFAMSTNAGSSSGPWDDDDFEPLEPRGNGYYSTTYRSKRSKSSKDGKYQKKHKLTKGYYTESTRDVTSPKHRTADSLAKERLRLRKSPSTRRVEEKVQTLYYPRASKHQYHQEYPRNHHDSTRKISNWESQSHIVTIRETETRIRRRERILRGY